MGEGLKRAKRVARATRKTRNNGWEPGRLVLCPCCRAEFDTDDCMRFTPADVAIHAAAREMLDKLKTVLEYCDAEGGALALCISKTIRGVVSKATA